MEIVKLYDTMNAGTLFLVLPLLAALGSLTAVVSKPSPALHARRWMVAAMICCALTALLLAHYYVPSLRESVALDLAYDAVLLCLAPCLYLSIYRLTTTAPRRWTDLWVFAPGTALWMIIALLCLVMGADESRAALAEIVLRLRPASAEHGMAYRLYAFFGHQFFRSYAILSLLVVLGWGARMIRDYGRALDDYLTVSTARQVDLWLLYVSFVLMVGGGMLFAACEYSQTFVPWVLPVFATTEAVSMLLMGYFARRVLYSAEQLHALRQTPELCPEPAPADHSIRLDRIQSEHLYHDPDLTLVSLSRVLCTNRTYLTQAFRQEYGCSFAEYINHLRVEEACTIMTEHPQEPLSEIASAVGYHSATSLYRNYVRIYHHPPRGRSKA